MSLTNISVNPEDSCLYFIQIKTWLKSFDLISDHEIDNITNFIEIRAWVKLLGSSFFFNENDLLALWLLIKYIKIQKSALDIPYEYTSTIDNKVWL